MKKKKTKIAHDIKFYARQMRREPTQAEKLVWDHLRKRNLNGYKFRRQHPLGRFILDFYCEEAKLAIEIDGEIHDLPLQKLRDEMREKLIVEKGIRMLRFKNYEVIHEMTRVLDCIMGFLPHPAGWHNPG